jgi:hypothetical protein
MQYEIQAINVGVSESQSVVLEHPVPAFGELAELETTHGSAQVGAGQVVAQLGDIPAGGVARIRLTVNPTNSVDVAEELTATVRTGGTDAYAIDNRIATEVELFADVDGDSLPDRLESEVGLNPSAQDDPEADHDQDGMNNRQEVWAGTDPFLADSVFEVQMKQPSAEQVQLMFDTVPGRVYRVEAVGRLNESWQSVGDPVPGGDGTVAFEAEAPPHTRYFRIRVQLD